MDERRLTRYLRAVRRRLALPREQKNRVIDDLRGSIAERQEAGQTEDQIFAALGSARQTAAELNEQLRANAYRKSPWRFVCLAAAAASLVSSVGLLIDVLLFRSALHSTVGVIGGADGPTAIFVTSSHTVGWKDWGLLALSLLILAAGIFGYVRLRRLPPKDTQ